MAWSCALPLPPLEPAATPAEALTQSLLQEVGSLAPWYAESIRRPGRTTFGLSDLTANRMDEIAEFLARMATGEDLEPPEGLADPMPQAIRFMADDVKAYYMEAANEQPGAPPLRRRARGAYRGQRRPATVGTAATQHDLGSICQTAAVTGSLARIHVQPDLESKTTRQGLSTSTEGGG